ncbi:hypothetical protein FCULG_00000851 [Fusarium culmorum]|uniref:Uncharacterized protein n=1 Tax=Fusarium culmorum TaxID=5516 RepID=A0A2T4GIX4_FUSCU|nr:hypothetical protein FCULG_00000851 [Fusarium culmorum]
MAICQLYHVRASVLVGANQHASMLSMSQGAEHALHILISTTRHQDDLTPSGERLVRVPTVEESIVPVRRGTIRPIYNIGNWANPGHLTAIFQVFVLTGIEYSGLSLSVYMYKHVCIPWQSQSQEIMPAGELSSSPVNLEMFHSLRASLILGSVHAHTMRRSSDASLQDMGIPFLGMQTPHATVLHAAAEAQIFLHIYIFNRELSIIGYKLSIRLCIDCRVCPAEGKVNITTCIGKISRFYTFLSSVHSCSKDLFLPALRGHGYCVFMQMSNLSENPCSHDDIP